MRYLFKHVLMRDAVYGLQLRSHLRQMHLSAAQAIEALYALDLSSHYADLAYHYEQAGQIDQAIFYLGRAGRQLLDISAFREALRSFTRLLGLLSAESRERAELLIQMGKALMWLGNYEQARQQLESGLALAQQLGDGESSAAALDHLGLIAREQGDLTLAQAYLVKSLNMARQIDDRARIAHVLLSLGWVGIRLGAHSKALARLSASQALYRALGNQHGLSRVFNGLGMVALGQGEYEKARDFYLQSLTLSQQLGARRDEAVALGNLGEVARLQGDYAAALQYNWEALSILKEIGTKANIAAVVANLGHVALAQRDYASATSYYHEAIQIAADTATVPNILDGLAGLAGALVLRGQTDRGLELIGLALNHPSLDSCTMPVIDQTLAELRAQLSPEQIEAGLECGKALDLEAVVKEILAEPLDLNLNFNLVKDCYGLYSRRAGN